MLSRSLAVFFQQCRSFAHAIRHVPTLEASSSDVAAALSRDIDLYEDFITEEEEASMLAEVEPYLQKLHYEFDHWDDVSRSLKFLVFIHFNNFSYGDQSIIGKCHKYFNRKR